MRGFVALVLPCSRPITRSPVSTESAATPFREPLQFIVIAVMSVMSGTFPDTYGVFYMTVNCRVFGDRHVIVMVSVIGEIGLAKRFLATMTVMTLMTMIYGLILDRGRISTS